MTNRLAVKVTFDNGDHICTEINGTKETVSDYYAVGKTFNLGVEDDLMCKVTNLEFLEN